MTPKVAVIVTDVDRLDFGPAQVGFSVLRRLEVLNTGPDPAWVRAVEIPDQVAFEVPNDAFPLGPGERRSLEVTFRPPAPAAFAGKLRLVVTEAQAEVVEVLLLGQVAPYPLNGEVSLGHVPLGEYVERTYRTPPLTPFGGEVAIALREGDRCGASARAGFCLRAPVETKTLGPEESVEVILGFRGVEPGLADDVLVIGCVDCALPANLALQAIVDDEVLRCEPLAARPAEIGACAPAPMVCINQSPTALTVTAASVVGDGVTLEWPTPMPLGPGAALELPLRHCRSGAAAHTATVTVEHERLGIRRTTKTQLGLPALAPRLSVTPTAVDMGQLRLGETRTRPIHLRSQGVGAVVGVSARLEGPGAAAFELEAVPNTIDEVDLTRQLEFKGTSVGRHQAELVIARGPGQPEQRIPLAGEVVAPVCTLDWPDSRGPEPRNLGTLPTGRHVRHLAFTARGHHPCEVEITRADGSPELTFEVGAKITAAPMSVTLLPFTLDLPGPLGSVYEGEVVLELSGTTNGPVNFRVRAEVGLPPPTVDTVRFQTCREENDFALVSPAGGYPPVRTLVIEQAFGTHSSRTPLPAWDLTTTPLPFSLEGPGRGGIVPAWISAITATSTGAVEVLSQSALVHRRDELLIEASVTTTVAVLVVLDASPSMATRVAWMLETSAIYAASPQYPNFKIGLTTMDPLRGGELAPVWANGARYERLRWPPDNQRADETRDVVINWVRAELLTPRPRVDVEPMAAIARALGPEALATRHAGFYEPGDDLVVVVLAADDVAGTTPWPVADAVLARLPTRTERKRLMVQQIPWNELCRRPEAPPEAYGPLAELYPFSWINACFDFPFVWPPDEDRRRVLVPSEPAFGPAYLITDGVEAAAQMSDFDAPFLVTPSETHNYTVSYLSGCR